MIPEDPTPLQPQTTSCLPHGPCCPWCGRAYFSREASALLDYVTLAQDVLRDLATALEAEVCHEQ